MATKKVKGPNWANIKKLRDHLAKLRQTKYRKFNMADYIQIISGKEYGDTVSVGELRKNGPECGSAACLAGETVILLAPATMKFGVTGDDSSRSYDLYLKHNSVEPVAKKLLGLNNREAWHMFSGDWSQNFLERKTKQQAIRYLDKAIKERDILVCLDS